VSINIYNEKDELVNKFYNSSWEEQGEHYIVWAGDYNDGKLVPPGKYKIVITGKPLSYARRFLEKKIIAEVICTE
jgi:flagellar hook assembly protein FlgD